MHGTCDLISLLTDELEVCLSTRPYFVQVVGIGTKPVFPSFYWLLWLEVERKIPCSRSRDFICAKPVNFPCYWPLQQEAERRLTVQLVEFPMHGTCVTLVIDNSSLIYGLRVRISWLAWLT